MLIRSKNFNIAQIANSGQCFRMNEISENKFSMIAYGTYIELEQLDEETVNISCSEEDFHERWVEYFDFKYDYDRIVKELIQGKDQFLKAAAEYGKGIRILKQEPFEMLISYIISQNKNIPSIKNCIERICERYGEKRRSDQGEGVTYYTFPSPDRLAKASAKDLRELKLGYRDEYIINAAQAVVQGELPLEKLMGCSFEEAAAVLKKIRGIGNKVANCILLYGLHHIEAFPVDVWIAKVLKEIYDNRFDVKIYDGYAGIVQQYMFYYMRNLKGV
ncbi:MAG: hypothetical protein K0S76_622 [Herbinix sp.]|jgi:N-glycosylase/DNA lyase|nr:hypothetical protein [Herbinix sp.]